MPVTQLPFWFAPLGLDTSLAREDDLTGLPDSASLDDVLARVTQQSVTTYHASVFVAVSLDQWAQIARAVKPEQQSTLLRSAAERLQRLASPRQGYVCWLTGETFGVVLPECDADQFEQFAGNVLAAFRKAQPAAGLSWPMLVSVGGVEIPRVAAKPEGIRTAALTALAHAQQQGGNRAVLAASAQDYDAENTAFEDLVAATIQTGKIALAYQPIVGAKNGVVTGYEALARIILPTGEVLPAARFMPVVERLGLTLELDSQVLRAALNELFHHPDLHLAINISGPTASSPEWTTLVAELFDDKAGLGRRLTFEITETAAITSLVEAGRLVALCKKFGIAVSFDDFCTGQTSLKHLRALPSDQIKIDRSMVMALMDEPQTQGTVRSLLRMARALGIQTVAEGVDHPAIAAWLEAEQVDFMQGYLYAKPETGRPWITFETDGF